MPFSRLEKARLCEAVSRHDSTSGSTGRDKRAVETPPPVSSDFHARHIGPSAALFELAVSWRLGMLAHPNKFDNNQFLAFDLSFGL